MRSSGLKMIIVLLLLGVYLVKGQVELIKNKTFTPNIVTPEVYNLGLYGDYPVDYSTGVPKIDIPLYTIRSGSLSLPISLSYHASGIKVRQESTPIGLGWTLNAGGMIVRQVRDIPDETINNGFIESGKEIPFFNDINTNGFQNLVVGEYDNNELLKSFYGTLTILGGGNEWHKDKYPDIFTILTNTGLSGEFLYDNEGKIVSSFVDKQKIICDLNRKKILITNTDGVQYTFGRDSNGQDAFDYFKRITEEIYDINNNMNRLNYLYKIPHSKTWYLTEIISADKKDKITFIYDEVQTSLKDVVSQSKGWPIGMSSNEYAPILKIPEIKTTLTVEEIRLKILKKIIFREGWVEFIPTYDRTDVIPTHRPIPRISEIRCYGNNNLLTKKIILDNNHYFYRSGRNISPFYLKDLKLIGIKILNSGNSKMDQYGFEYDESIPLPSKKSNSIDFWGYYNGKENHSLLPDEIIKNLNNHPYDVSKDNFTNIKRQTDFNYMKAFSLKKIIYPTRGYSIYDFEPNYFLKTTQELGFKEIYKNHTFYAINDASLCREQEFFRGIESRTKVEIDFEPNDDRIVDLNVFFSDYQFSKGQPMYVKIKQGLTQEINDLIFTHDPQNMQNYKTINKKFNVSNKLSIELNTNNVKGTSKHGPCENPFISVSLSYKSREKAKNTGEIIPTEAGGLRVKKITNYDANNNIISIKSYEYGNKVQNNIGVGEIISNPFEIENYYKKIWPILYCKLNDVQYYTMQDALILTSNPVLELGNNNGNPVFYKKVTEYIEDIGSKRKLKTDFFYEKPGQDIISSGDEYMNSPTIIYPSWKKGYLSKKVIYKGSTTYYPIRKEEYGYNDSQENHIRTLNLLEIGPEPMSIMFDKKCAIYLTVGNFKKRFKVFNDYTSIGRRELSQMNITEYLYKNKKDSIKTFNSYLYDINSNRILKTFISFPDKTAQTTTYHYPHDKNNQYLISKNMIGIPLETIVTQNGKVISKTETIYPTSQQEADLKTNGLPLPISTITRDLENSNKSKENIVYTKYDDKGNLLEYKINNITPVTIIYGYNQTLPIAKIEGATYEQVKNLVSDIITKSNNDRNEITENTLQNALNIFRNREELKYYQITTYTHNPLIGVTSITPPNGITEFYKYDDSNRLSRIIDINGQILKEFSYNYANSTPAPKYFNTEKSQVFRKRYCPTNAIGQQYTYTVPQGKYISYISQEDADQKALDDISANGQNEADKNSSCSSMNCSFSLNGFSGGGGVSVNGDMYKINLSFSTGYGSSRHPWQTGIKIGSITGNCIPKSDYNSYNGQVYYTIKTNGDIIIRTHLGSPAYPDKQTLNYTFYFPIN